MDNQSKQRNTKRITTTKKFLTKKIYRAMTMTTTTQATAEWKSEQEKLRELTAALKYYVRFHLKPGDLERLPELKNYLD